MQGANQLDGSRASTSAKRRGPLALALGVLLWLACVFCVLELGLNAYFLWFPPELDRYLIGDNFDHALRFDVIRGRWIESVENRVALFYYGTREYVATPRGNAQGFSDRDDFSAVRSEPSRRRVGLFGDSFSAGTYLELNWPDRVEDLAKGGPAPLEVLNFSQDAGGLANWWSVLTRLVEPEDYELDAAVFASYPGDLQRNFSFADGRGPARVLLGNAASWDPETWPASDVEARSQMTASPLMIQVAKPEFDAAVRGEWLPAVETRLEPKLPIAIRLLKPALRMKFLEGRALVGLARFRGFDPGRERLIREMRQLLDRRRLPALVVFVPSRPHLLGSASDRQAFEETQAFASLLGAEFVDGSHAFAGFDSDAVQAHWLRYDNHWNQRGSDRFAQFMVEKLSAWPPETNEQLDP